MSHNDERELRRLLRNAHEVLDPAPPQFAATLAAARRRGDCRRASRVPTTAAAAATFVVVAASIYAIYLGRPQPTDPDTTGALRIIESLSAWREPTAFLDRIPGAELLEDPPPLGASGSLPSLSRSRGSQPWTLKGALR